MKRLLLIYVGFLVCFSTGAFAQLVDELDSPFRVRGPLNGVDTLETLKGAVMIGRDGFWSDSMQVKVGRFWFCRLEVEDAIEEWALRHEFVDDKWIAPSDFFGPRGFLSFEVIMCPPKLPFIRFDLGISDSLVFQPLSELKDGIHRSLSEWVQFGYIPSILLHN